MGFAGHSITIDSIGSGTTKDISTIHSVVSSADIEVTDLSKLPVLTNAKFVPASLDIADTTISYDVISGTGSYSGGRIYIQSDDASLPRIVNVALDPSTSSNVTVDAVAFGNDYVFLDFRGLKYNADFKINLLVTFDEGNQGRPSYGDMDLTSSSLPSLKKVGSAGNDIVDFKHTSNTSVTSGMTAGDGIDTLRVDGASREYRVNVQGQDSAVIGQLNLDRGFGTTEKTMVGGINYVSEMERISFTDGTLALDTGYAEHAGTAFRTYYAAFDRAPDKGGLAFHIANLDAGENFSDMANGFLNSPEFLARYGTGMSNAQYVDSLYHNTLGRDGDAGGIAYWNNLLDSGQAGRADVLIGFANSPENMAKVASMVAQGIWMA